MLLCGRQQRKQRRCTGALQEPKSAGLRRAVYAIRHDCLSLALLLARILSLVQRGLHAFASGTHLHHCQLMPPGFVCVCVVQGGQGEEP